jgi:N6-L-threonylcarbamoyladenine synthase
LGHAAATGGPVSPAVADLVASFQKAVVDVLVQRTLAVCRRESVRNVLVAGGVACNGRLRREFSEAAEREGRRLFMPSPPYTTDNAAMIAAAGFLHLERGDQAPGTINAEATLPL